MKTLKNTVFSKTAAVPPSKSEAQRYIICAAFSDGPTEIYLPSSSLCDDIKACISAVCALGAEAEISDEYIRITPAKLPLDKARNYSVNFGESGTAYRFLLPIIKYSGISAEIITEGTLGKRPVGELLFSAENLAENCDISVDGTVSSQYVSGLLYALCFTGGTLTVTGKTVSSPYIYMTMQALRLFGAHIVNNGCSFFSVAKIERFASPGKVCVSGDWSAAAFPLAAGLIGRNPVTVCGLSTESVQGDAAIIGILRSFGGKIEITDEGITSYPSALEAPGEIDMQSYPDLVPAVALCGAVAKGETVLSGINHLRYKESNRIDGICRLISSAGGNIVCRSLPYEPLLVINGVKKLCGAHAETSGDHRIAMAAAVISLAADGETVIDDSDCISKSWPEFMNYIKEDGK